MMTSQKMYYVSEAHDLTNFLIRFNSVHICVYVRTYAFVSNCELSSQDANTYVYVNFHIVSNSLA